MPSVYVPSALCHPGCTQDMSKGALAGMGGYTMMSHTGNIREDSALHKAGSSSMGSPAALRKINRQSEHGTRVHNDIVDFHA